MKRCRDPRCSPRGNPACRGTFGGRMKAVRSRFALPGGTGDFPWDAVTGKASSCQEVGTTWFFSSFSGILVLRQGITGFLFCQPWVPQPSILVRGKAGGCARVTAEPKRPHLGVCPGPNAPLQGRQGSRGCIPCSPGESGLASRGIKGLRSPP